MNDFTKEELETLFHWGIDRVQAIGTECFEEEDGDKLYEKLRIMLENYCEHESYPFCYTSDPPTYKCKKCGVLYRD